MMKSSMSRRAALIASSVLAGFAPLSAQQTSTACPGGAAPVPSIGIVGLGCSNCSSRTVGGVAMWSFEREPEIITVDSRGPDAGVLKPGDVIVAIDGLLITTSRGGERFSRVAPGERVRVRVRRGGALRELELEAYSYCRGQSGAAAGRVHPESEPTLPRLDEPEPLPRLLPEGSLGIGIACECTVEVQAQPGRPARWRFQQAPEVQAVDPDGAGAAAGLRPGDLLLEINGQSLLSDDGAEIFSTVRPGQVLRLLVKRAGQNRSLTLTASPR